MFPRPWKPSAFSFRAECNRDKRSPWISSSNARLFYIAHLKVPKSSNSGILLLFSPSSTWDPHLQRTATKTTKKSLDLFYYILHFVHTLFLPCRRGVNIYFYTKKSVACNEQGKKRRVQLHQNWRRRILITFFPPLGCFFVQLYVSLRLLPQYCT